ncbi:hypothetical protein EXIGLDRAFT_357121 [Exidia glandulosa HHB12029]|uniref:Uncharacterized protein n=1 Tax=Exidia glandulosa HHB12029 TaxID=1314781 RepID=A0A165C994_EXIGL|nr:hypothetical protein EXIGLDRAFT_357121 [Exidia glandulosa HHB12029]
MALPPDGRPPSFKTILTPVQNQLVKYLPCVQDSIPTLEASSVSQYSRNSKWHIRAEECESQVGGTGRRDASGIGTFRRASFLNNHVDHHHHHLSHIEWCTTTFTGVRPSNWDPTCATSRRQHLGTGKTARLRRAGALSISLPRSSVGLAWALSRLPLRTMSSRPFDAMGVVASRGLSSARLLTADRLHRASDTHGRPKLTKTALTLEALTTLSSALRCLQPVCKCTTRPPLPAFAPYQPPIASTSRVRSRFLSFPLPSQREATPSMRRLHPIRQCTRLAMWRRIPPRRRRHAEPGNCRSLPTTLPAAVATPTLNTVAVGFLLTSADPAPILPVYWQRSRHSRSRSTCCINSDSLQLYGPHISLDLIAYALCTTIYAFTPFSRRSGYRTWTSSYPS